MSNPESDFTNSGNIPSQPDLAVDNERLLGPELAMEVVLLNSLWQKDEHGKFLRRRSQALLKDGTYTEVIETEPLNRTQGFFANRYWVKTSYIYEPSGVIEIVDYRWNNDGRLWAERVQETYINSSGELAQSPSVRKQFTVEDINEIEWLISEVAKSQKDRDDRNRQYDQEFGEIVVHHAARDPRAQGLAEFYRKLIDGESVDNTEVKKMFQAAGEWMKNEYGLERKHLQPLVEVASAIAEGKSR